MKEEKQSFSHMYILSKKLFIMTEYICHKIRFHFIWDTLYNDLEEGVI